jgi:hypothetical protein
MLRFSDWSPPRAFPFTNAARLTKQYIWLNISVLLWWFPFKHQMKPLLHCSLKSQLVKHHTFSSFYLKYEFYNCDSSDHKTYWNAFSFHPCAFQFISGVTVKWYTFHVYTMIWWRVEIMNLLMQLHPVSCFFLHFVYDRVSVCLYFPSIRWCLQCQRFGHTHQKCASDLVHGICNESGHGESPCFSPLHGGNYSGAHASGDGNCPVYQNE